LFVQAQYHHYYWNTVVLFVQAQYHHYYWNTVVLFVQAKIQWRLLRGGRLIIMAEMASNKCKPCF
jgi:hypothetical protein